MSIDVAVRSNLYSRSCDETLVVLDVDRTYGLTAKQVAERQKTYGKNLIQQRKNRAILSLFAEQFRGVIVWLLSAAALLSFAVGEIPEGVAIVCVLVINTMIGFVTRWKAVRSMEALYRMIPVTARIRREGLSELIPIHELTPGDIVLLEGGDIVPAGLRLLEATNLYCDESTLTGESAPVQKTTEALPVDTFLADRTNVAFKGVAVVRGAGVGVVSNIGGETELGRISELLQDAKAKSHPLEKRLDKLGEALVGITFVLSFLIALAGYLRGFGLVEMVETAIALVVAAVPEGLPVVATLALARGMFRMARRNTLIARLSAVETLGAATIILTDKTGTLTENRMTVSGFLLDGRDIEVGGGLKKTSVAEDQVLRRALEIGALCNTAEMTSAGIEGETAGVGDPMELALLDVAHSAGVQPDLDPDDRPEVSMHSFDSSHNMMATVHRVEDGYFTAVKGAPEAVLKHADRVLTDGDIVEVTDSDRANWLARVEASARKGYRLIGLACKYHQAMDEVPYDSLTLVGFVCLLDPLRKDVAAAVAQSQGAGVRVVMMTGDHIATATEIATQAGLADDGRIVALTELDLQQLGTDDPQEDLRDKLLKADVFARVSPESKLKLVEFYQDAGHVVAMTGDGVNDAPALKKADIGIAMGQRGTQVARDAADMVLKDDAFNSIIAAMQQGRVIFGNIRRFVVYLMSCNFSEIMVVGIAILAGLAAPLTPLQILFLNIVTDVFPAFALGLGEGGGNVMKQPPRDPAKPIIDRSRWMDIFMFGGIITVTTLSVYWMALGYFEMLQEDATTVAFLTLALAQLWHVFNMREPEEPVFVNSVVKNPYVWAAISLCIFLLAAAFYIPVLSDVLNLRPLSVSQLVLSVGASLIPLLLGQIWVAIRGKAKRIVKGEPIPAP